MCVGRAEFSDILERAEANTEVWKYLFGIHSVTFLYRSISVERPRFKVSSTNAAEREN